MEFTWAHLAVTLLAGQPAAEMFDNKVLDSPSHPLLFLAVARGSGRGHTLGLPSVGGASGVGHTRGGQLAPSGAPVLLLVPLVEGRPQGHAGGWAGAGGPRLQAGWGTGVPTGLLP